MPGSSVKVLLSDLSFLDYFIVDKYASAIFADNDLLPRFNIELPLGRYLVEAASACIALNWHNSQSVSCI